jgi:hypothetical protein
MGDGKTISLGDDGEKPQMVSVQWSVGISEIVRRELDERIV